MIGYLRFFLASLVVYSHLDFPLWSFLGLKINQGVFAVFCFYIISGFFTALIFDRFKNSKNQMIEFYFDRLLRLVPLFCIVMCLVFLGNQVQFTPSLRILPEHAVSLKHLFLSFLQPINGVVGFLLAGDFSFGAYSHVTPAPSLALEVKYFFIFPFLALLRSSYLKTIMGAAVVCTVYCLHRQHIDLVESFTYRYLFGTLPLFLTGFIIYRQNKGEETSQKFKVEYIAAGIGILYCSLLLAMNLERVPWLMENALALLLCPAALKYLLKFKSGKIDHLAGYLSYGIFLVHIPIIHFLNIRQSKVEYLLAVLVLASALSFILHHLVERPVLKIRHRKGR